MPGSSPAPQTRSSSSRRGTRTIKNLNEEQLRNKRLVDRKAQQAFRQRNKDCMSKLVALQEVCSQKDDEIKKLRHRNGQLLMHLRAIFRSVSGVTQFLEDHREPDGALADMSPDPDGLNDTVPYSAGPGEEAHNGSGDEPLVPPSAPTPGPVQVSPPAQASTQAAQSTASDGGLTSPYSHIATVRHIEDLQHQDSRFTATQSSSNNRYYATSSHPPVAGGYDELGIEDSSPRQPFSDHRESIGRRSIVSSVLPVFSAPTCPLDHILTDFRQSRCEQLARGLPLTEIVGPQIAGVSALFDADHVEGKSPLSSMLCQVLSTFPHPKITEKLAFFYLMYQTMRWLVSPATETYDSMPPWLRPTVTQITVPHAPWIDNIPWPGVRDMLIEQPEEYPFESFSEHYSEHVRVNWPFDSHDAVSAVDGDLILHSIFLKHVGDLKHWTVTPQFLERYPGMAHAVSSHQEP